LPPHAPCTGFVRARNPEQTSCQQPLPTKRRKTAYATADFFHRYLYALAEIHASFDLEVTQNAITSNAARLYGARGAGLMLFNPSEENLIVSATFGLSETYRTKGTISPRKSLGETIDGAPVIVRDIANDSRVQYPEAALQEGIRCIVGLPLAAGKALVGALRLYFAQPRDFNPEEIESLKALSHQAGLALKKGLLRRLDERGCLRHPAYAVHGF